MEKSNRNTHTQREREREREREMCKENGILNLYGKLK